MSAAKHTPGQGSVVNNPDSHNGGNAASVYWGPTYVADVYSGYVGSERVSKDEQQANARLIAAAPALFAACSAYLADRDEAGCMADSNAVQAMRAALAKAQGASQ